MRKVIERNECLCPPSKQVIKICADVFNTKICTECYNIISYEKPDKKEFMKVNQLNPGILEFKEVLNLVRP